MAARKQVDLKPLQLSSKINGSIRGTVTLGSLGDDALPSGVMLNRIVTLHTS